MNTSLAQQDTINVTQGKTTYILKEDEIRDHLPAETITIPLQESGTVAPRRRMSVRPPSIVAPIAGQPAAPVKSRRSRSSEPTSSGGSAPCSAMRAPGPRRDDGLHQYRDRCAQKG